MEEVWGDLCIHLCVIFCFCFQYASAISYDFIQGDFLIYETWNAQNILMFLASVLWENQKIFLYFCFDALYLCLYVWFVMNVDIILRVDLNMKL